MQARVVTTDFQQSKLELKSTLNELPLWNFSLEVDIPGERLAELFKQDSLLPGVILIEDQVYVGMISRRKFFEHMSRPYSLGLFSGRKIKYLYQFLQSEILIFSGNTPIVKATEMVINRESELVYEPVVVIESGKYGVLDFQQLLLAYSQIHILTLTQLQKKEEQFLVAQTNLHQLQQNYLRVIHTKNKAVLEDFIGGVSNQIHHPTNFITGNLIHANRYIQQLIQLINLYQQHYPEPVADIQATINQIKLDLIKVELPKLTASMKSNARNIQQVIKYLHNFQTLDKSETKSVDIHEVIDSILSILKHHLKFEGNQEIIKIIKEYNNLHIFNCCVTDFYLVFLHIFSYIITTLKSQEITNQEIHICTSKINNNFIINIKYNDAGMSAEARDSIFVPLFTNQAFEERRIGLSISNLIIVEKYHGKLECTSLPDKGTEFLIKIPV